ncbi:MAG: HAD family hydrolase [Alphaproteobacteria bacterium]|nr:HAD family hydrolase [Alphaproteobacteria bacterium]
MSSTSSRPGKRKPFLKAFTCPSASSQHRAVSFDVTARCTTSSVTGTPAALAAGQPAAAAHLPGGRGGPARGGPRDLRAELCRRIGARIGLPQERVEPEAQPQRLWRLAGEFQALDGLEGPAALLLRVLDAEGVPRVVISDHPAHAKLGEHGHLGGLGRGDRRGGRGCVQPHPRAIERAAQALGLEPAQILHVGDRADTDGAMAEAVGATCLIRGGLGLDGPAGRLLFGKPWPELRRAHGG